MVYDKGDTYLLERLRNMELSGLDLVIDAACGEGDMLPSLSGLNKTVAGFDNFHASAIKAGELILSRQLNNVLVLMSDMLNIAIKENSADGILCFDSFQYVNPYEVFKEFRRILRKGGKVYINTNALGWAFHTLVNRGIRKRDIKKINMGLRILFDFGALTVNRRHKVVSTFYTEARLKKIARDSGFSVIYTGEEGSYNNEGFKKYPPLFGAKYMGLAHSIEAVLEKR